ncbi:DUF4349 domain-containing protein [Acinetobacter chinensis]|uniref:DUF4349 domain-containing protein n=1 Tax=Acinetobacter chinensis TaxID=2004650 RepID=A0A3B7M1G3_9GAMM|nr:MULTISPECIES: DUF4349 domain-containing protein [Acinetobacter]AXY56519.1 DUF4349 domain-containing protein [Acinetobacter chinensis]AXY59907.1 DUF4349 domain-containing protein [Acinetobacter sp. WCHAc010052]WOE42961.1 DUF4349 domain-containing protein [Acinetobacter chinensis]
MNQKISALILCSLLLNGCSKKMEEAPAEASTEAVAADSAVSMESEAKAQHEPDTTPQTEQKPDVILNTQVNSAESARRMVREASVDFTATDVIKTGLAIDKLTYEAGGFVEQKNIDFQVLDTQSQSISDGKIRVFEKVNPVAQIVVRVPSEKAAGFVNQLLPLMYFLNQQQYSAKRYELKLLEEKIAQTQSVPSDTRNSQLSEIARLTQMEVQDRVRYSTISLIVNQPSTVRERIDVDVDAVARLNGDSFWKRAWNGVQYGWQFVLDLLVILITVWPLYLIVLILYVLYRVLKPFLSKIK